MKGCSDCTRSAQNTGGISKTELGTDPEHPYDLDGEIEIWLDDEKYVINKSCLVFVPKGLMHCPLKITRMDRPFLHFVATSSKLYDQK